MSEETCIHCGKLYDPSEQSAFGDFNCSYHPLNAKNIGDTGPKGDHTDLWVFPCCGKGVFGDGNPPHSPGCLNAFHVARRSTVFLSYARTDAKFGGFLETELQRRGYFIWKDTTNLTAGEDWQQAINEAMEACSHFIIVLSIRSVTRPEVNRELGAALQAAKPIVPILLETCDVPPPLGRLNFIDWRDGSDFAYSQNFGRLDEALGDPSRLHFLTRFRSNRSP